MKSKSRESHPDAALPNAETRLESDSLGEVEVPMIALWGAQSQRSLKHFDIGEHQFPLSFIHALALIKKSAALVNSKLGQLEESLTRLISQASDEVLTGKHNGQFPLSIWQTGSGTQINMNVNEVIANLANIAAGNDVGTKSPVHPNDHVNLSQSSNDVVPTAMHLTTAKLVHEELLPTLNKLLHSLRLKALQFEATEKVGRTHLMDATPVTLGQEFSGFAAQLEFSMERLSESADLLSALPIGGTAVGNGFNRHEQWPQLMCETINGLTGGSFSPANDCLSQTAAHDTLTNVHAQLANLATALYKIASDIRLMNSGPRCGFAELVIPQNEPGSSMMPGKVNPTQVEALTMICLRVLGNDTAVKMANSQGQLELNTYKPLILLCLTESLGLLTDSCRSFDHFCVSGIEVNQQTLLQQKENSLMHATALSAELGYDLASKLVHYAVDKQKSLKQAAQDLEILSAEEFDRIVESAKLTGPFGSPEE